jgi:hypothetical protein
MLLRDYLYNRSSKRLWRLIAMGALVLFVVVRLFCQLSFYSDHNKYSSDAIICCFVRYSTHLIVDNERLELIFPHRNFDHLTKSASLI